MGLAILKHLKNSDYDVTVYDVREDQLQSAIEAGGIAARSPREVAEQSD